MRRLRSLVDLSWKVTEISMMELRKAPGEILSAAELGEKFVIMRNGKPIATLQRLPGETLPLYVKKDGTISYLTPPGETR